MKLKINGKESEVDFWGFFKMFAVCYGITMAAIFMFGFMIGYTLI